MSDDRQRRRMMGRLRSYLTRKRSPRSVLSAILVLTALTGFLASMGMLKMGLATMWMRYPLAVLLAWGVFLLLVRSWAERERAEVREEEMAELGPKDDVFDGGAGRSVLGEGEGKARWWDWLDWLNPLEWLGDDLAGCAVGVAGVAVVIALAGALVAIAGLIVQAEVLLAEVLLDVLLVSALNKRLHRLEPQWWLHGAVRQTVGPVLAAMAFLIAAGFLMAHYAPGADSVGDVWRHWRGPR